MRAHAHTHATERHEEPWQASLHGHLPTIYKVLQLVFRDF